MMKFRAFVIVAMFAAPLFAINVLAQTRTPPKLPQKQQRLELNTALMKCTFEIEGRNIQGQETIGTAFVMGRPIPGTPHKARYVMITAAHVLNGMAGDTALLHLRRKLGQNNWVPILFPVHIRANGRPLWTQNPDGDVAVMYVPLPAGTSLPLLSTDFLADDAMLSRFDIHPGDQLECLGYPLGLASNDAGFPILRSGRIASYPLLPTETVKTFLFDFRVFGGNSGGPVYFVQTDRLYGGSVHLGQTIAFIAGLVSQQKIFSQVTSGLYERAVREVPLDLAVVVDASLIRQAIEMLPPP